MKRRRLKGAAALSIVAVASAMGVASAAADEIIVCVTQCEIPPPALTTPGRQNAFIKIGTNSGEAFNKISENGAFLKFSWGRDFLK